VPLVVYNRLFLKHISIQCSCNVVDTFLPALNPCEQPTCSLPVAKVMSWMFYVPRANTKYINTFGNSHTTFCPFPRFCLFPISFLWHLCHASCLQAGGEILMALWGRLMEWVETAVKIEGGRERVRQETPNHSLSSASIHSPLHLGVQKECMWPYTPFISQEKCYMRMDDLQICVWHCKC